MIVSYNFATVGESAATAVANCVRYGRCLTIANSRHTKATILQWDPTYGAFVLEWDLCIIKPLDTQISVCMYISTVTLLKNSFQRNYAAAVVTAVRATSQLLLTPKISSCKLTIAFIFLRWRSHMEQLRNDDVDPRASANYWVDPFGFIREKKRMWRRCGTNTRIILSHPRERSER